MSAIINNREIMVSSMQRSAHHAFIMELLNSTEKHCYLNCISSPSLFRRKFINSNPEKRFVNDLDLNLDEEILGNFKPKELLVYSIEMAPTAKAFGIFQHNQTKLAAGNSAERYFVTWLRDPLNNLASHFNRAKKNSIRTGDPNATNLEKNEKLDAATKIWIDHWQAVKRQEAGLGIVANLWWSNDRYRAEFFDRFGLSVPGRNAQMSRWGGGSSFSKYHTDQAAPSVEELSTRFKEHMHDRDFLRIFKSGEFRCAVDDFFETFPELAELSNAWAEIKKIT